jgi:hypothetical protein
VFAIAFPPVLRLNRGGSRRGIIPAQVAIIRVLALGVLLLGAILPCAARDVAVIVNRSSPVRTLSSSELGKLANASLPPWPGGGKVTLILRDPNTPAMKIAMEKIFGTSAERIKTVMAANPGYFVVVNSDAEVIRMVESLSGAFGLIDIYSITSSVNVVKVNGKLPLEPGYALHGN